MLDFKYNKDSCCKIWLIRETQLQAIFTFVWKARMKTVWFFGLKRPGIRPPWWLFGMQLDCGLFWQPLTVQVSKVPLTAKNEG